MPRSGEEYRMEITQKIIEALENGTAPWQKPWLDYRPVNAVTGNFYVGINSIILSIEGEKFTTNEDSRWATRRQAESKKWSIKSDEKPITLKFFRIFEEEVESNRLRDIFQGRNVRKYAVSKTFEVFHASQIQGIPFLPAIRRKQKHIVNDEVIDKIIFNASARIYEGGNEACYSPDIDVIRMPIKKSFADTESYYSTLLHELAHWTGHRSRLDRIASFDRGSASYAREELVAEIASMFLSAEFGISQTQEHFDQHAAYINSWIKYLKSDPNAIFNAAKEAKKAANYILTFKEVEIKLAS
ncbi:MAG: DUF1738 domain-containing protein [Synergistaceae bacterium]|nr:DUF1738 domain-containing protein [Synergistaceae bacterium]